MVIPEVLGDRPDMVQQPRTSTHRRLIARWIALAIAVIASLAVVRAAGHFNQTFDEGAHVASGIEWFQFHTYSYDPQHPPLGRIAIALGPWLSGVRGSHLLTSWEEGNRILMDGSRYAHTLALARLGVLPFFLLLLATVWVWTRWRYGEAAALLAVLLTTTVSPVLAQAGLATTDMPLAGTLCFAWYALLRWLERPGRRRTALLALAFALAVTSKFSAVPYFCLAALFVVMWRLVFGDRARAGGDAAGPVVRWRFANLGAFVVPAVLGLIGAGIVIWGLYRFHVSWAHGGHIPVPAPELRAGLQQLMQHNAGGQAAYIFGHINRSGWWYFPLVELLVKAPLALLCLTALAIGVFARDRGAKLDWREVAPFLAVAAILLTAMAGQIDIGVRHIFLVYPLLAIPVSGVIVELWHDSARQLETRTALTVLLLWQVAASVHAYPDFLADFNALAGRHPERVLVDSNLDWGQDLRVLSDTLAARHVASVSLFYFGSTPVGAVHLADTVRLGGSAHATGWIAVSQTYLQGDYVDCFTWLRSHQPVARIGSSMLLYRILPDTVPRLPSGTVAVTSSIEPYGVPLGTTERQNLICQQPRVLVRGGTAAFEPAVAQEGDEPSGATSGTPASAADARNAPAAVSAAMLLDAPNDATNWLTYGRDYTNRRYSPLDQISTDNVNRLTLAWVHQLETPPGGQESSPVEVNGTLYYTGPFGAVVAVDARTGAELWRHQHKLASVPTCCGAKNRGVAVYGNVVYVSTLDDHVLALDNRTGSVLWDVQTADPDSSYSMTSAPLAVDGRIIVGIAGSDFAMRGFVDCYDARTGRRLWRFYTIPSPAEGGWWGKWSPTTPEGDRLPRDIAQEKRDSARYADAWKLGGGGVWNTPSYDPALHMIYFGVGNAAPNMDGSVRPGDNLYTASVVAVDINTGTLRWYYQEVPHDLWDYDASNPTVLFDVTVNGERVPAVAQAGKDGWAYILDRRTGQRIRRTSPFVPHENTFAAPTAAGTRIMPGMGGGANNAPPSFLPLTGLLYIAGIVEPVSYTLAPEPLVIGSKYQGGNHYPLAPATGTLTAIDVNTGEVRWQTKTAERMLGNGTLATAGDLVFYGEQQGVFHAADARTGKILWTSNTGGHVRAPPVTYEVDGTQYVAIAAGGALFSFSLPADARR